MSVIEVNNLSKIYKKTFSLKDISLEVEKGDIYGLIGPNKSGKSTLIKIFLNLIFKSSGDVKIFGLDVKKHTVSIKKRMGYAPSDVRYYPHMNSKEILNTTMKFRNIKDTKNRDYLIEVFKMDGKKKFKDLSVSNKKKVAIAQALISKPELIILDEPTNGLDTLAQKQLFILLKDMVKLGSTVFISSHNMEEVEEQCNKVAFIKEGEILQKETLSDDRKNNKLYGIKYIAGKKIESGIQNILNMKDIEILTEKDSYVQFIYKNGVGSIMSKVNYDYIVDIEVGRISLEQKFLRHYKER